MKRAYDDMVYHAEIKWSKPKKYDNALDTLYEDLEDVFFYKIIARHKGNYKLLYIGKTYRQYASDRLLNMDHKKKREELDGKFPRHDLLISFGNLKTNRQKNVRFIDEIESLLIYIHSDSGFTHLTNKSNKWSHNILRDYQIENKGFRADGMVKEIGLGLFYKD
ncbi:MAG: hypothetical protein JXR07_11945 [Reichenbachiella sp.]